MSDDIYKQYHVCMHHGSHTTRLRHLDKELERSVQRLDLQDKRLDDLSVAHAKTTAKITGAVGVMLALLQIALKVID